MRKFWKARAGVRRGVLGVFCFDTPVWKDFYFEIQNRCGITFPNTSWKLPKMRANFQTLSKANKLRHFHIKIQLSHHSALAAILQKAQDKFNTKRLTHISLCSLLRRKSWYHQSPVHHEGVRNPRPSTSRKPAPLQRLFGRRWGCTCGRSPSPHSVSLF